MPNNNNNNQNLFHKYQKIYALIGIIYNAILLAFILLSFIKSDESFGVLYIVIGFNGLYSIFDLITNLAFILSNPFDQDVSKSTLIASISDTLFHNGMSVISLVLVWTRKNHTTVFWKFCFWIVIGIFIRSMIMLASELYWWFMLKKTLKNHTEDDFIIPEEELNTQYHQISYDYHNPKRLFNQSNVVILNKKQKKKVTRLQQTEDERILSSIEKEFGLLGKGKGKGKGKGSKIIKSISSNRSRIQSRGRSKGSDNFSISTSSSVTKVYKGKEMDQEEINKVMFDEYVRERIANDNEANYQYTRKQNQMLPGSYAALGSGTSLNLLNKKYNNNGKENDEEDYLMGKQIRDKAKAKVNEKEYGDKDGDENEDEDESKGKEEEEEEEDEEINNLNKDDNQNNININDLSLAPHHLSISSSSSDSSSSIEDIRDYIRNNSKESLNGPTIVEMYSPSSNSHQGFSAEPNHHPTSPSISNINDNHFNNKRNPSLNININGNGSGNGGMENAIFIDVQQNPSSTQDVNRSSTLNTVFDTNTINLEDLNSTNIDDQKTQLMAYLDKLIAKNKEKKRKRQQALRENPEKWNRSHPREWFSEVMGVKAIQEEKDAKLFVKAKKKKEKEIIEQKNGKFKRRIKICQYTRTSRIYL